MASLVRGIGTTIREIAADPGTLAGKTRCIQTGGVVETVDGMPPAPGTPGTWILFGHDTCGSATITISTITGQATAVGGIGFPALSSGMTTAPGTVMTSHGVLYPASTVFGLFRDQNLGKDYVTTLNPVSGQQNKVVELDLSINGRGVAFGFDGTLLYFLIPPGELYTVSPLNGAASLVGKVLDDAGSQFPGTSLALDRASGELLAFAGRSQDTLIRIDPLTARTQVIGSLPESTSCSLAVAPDAVPGPGGTTFPAGTFFTFNRSTNQLTALQMDVANLKITKVVAIGRAGDAPAGACATAFGLRNLPTPQVTAWTPTPFPTGTPAPPGLKTPTPGVASPTQAALSLDNLDVVFSERFEAHNLNRWANNDDTRLQLKRGAGHEGSTALSAELGADAAYLSNGDTARFETGFLSFRFHRNSASIPYTAGAWLPGQSVVVAAIRGVDPWNDRAHPAGRLSRITQAGHEWSPRFSDHDSS